MPFAFVFLPVAAVATTIVLFLFSKFGIRDGVWTTDAYEFDFPWATWRTSLGIAIVAGSLVGVGTWHDWQVDQPCI